MNTADQIIDAVFDDGAPLDPQAHLHDEAAALPDATFASVYGRSIYSSARKTLATEASHFGWSERDRDAYWPTALTNALSTHLAYAADSGRSLPDTPTDEEMKTAKIHSRNFLDAWKCVTGNDMVGGRLPAHSRIRLAKMVPEKFMCAARELRDEGICHFTARCFERGQDLRRGERTRSDAQRGRETASVDKVRQRQRVR